MRRISALAILILAVFSGKAHSGEEISLDAFLGMVLSNNDALISAANAADASYFAARSSIARQRPSLGASAAGSYLSGMDNGVRESDIGGFEIKLEIIQPIDISGRFGIEERQALLSVEMKRVELEDAVNSLLADAEESYWSAIFAIENTALQEAVLQRRMENRRITEGKYDRELVPRLDVIRADALVIEAEAFVAQAEAERLNILAEMASLAGGRRIQPIGTLSVPSFQEDDSDDALFERRPDVKAARLSLLSARTAKDLAAREMSPTLEASASWTPYSDPSGSGSPQRGEIETSLRLSIPILDGRSAEFHRSHASALIQSTEASLRHVQETAVKEIEIARNNRDLAIAVERAKKSEMEKTDEELRITELMYMEGMGAQTDLINAQIENRRVRTEYLRAVKDLHVSAARLRKAVGGYAAKFPARG